MTASKCAHATHGGLFILHEITHVDWRSSAIKSSVEKVIGHSLEELIILTSHQHFNVHGLWVIGLGVWDTLGSKMFKITQTQRY